MIASIVMLLIYRLNLSCTIWIGLITGIIVIYYLNERSAQTLNTEADQLWAVLKSPYLKNTTYFITDPTMIRWVDDVSEFKKYNVLTFNKMIATLDHFLRLNHEFKMGINEYKENLDLVKDLKREALAYFHSMIYNINQADLRLKFEHYLTQLGQLLNERHAFLIKLVQLEGTFAPVNIDSHLAVTGIDEPTPDDPRHEPNYHFYQ